MLRVIFLAFVIASSVAALACLWDLGSFDDEDEDNLILWKPNDDRP